MKKRCPIWGAAAVALLAWGASPPTRTLVVCAPGFPGNTGQAQPTMDAFALAAERAAGWPVGTLGAAYYEKAQAGSTRLEQPDSVLAIVTLPYFAEFGADPPLKPRLQVVRESGPTEVWSLVAKRGRVTSAASLDGWEITGAIGYAPDFVRGTLLAAWGTLPASARVAFTTGVLSALRRAASGENVAVLLDRDQEKALAGLPFGKDLDVVFRSKPLPGTLLCTVGDRLPEGQAAALIKALLRLHKSPEGAEILKAMQIVRFEPVEGAAIEGLRRAVPSTPGAAR